MFLSQEQVQYKSSLLVHQYQTIDDEDKFMRKSLTVKDSK